MNPEIKTFEGQVRVEPWVYEHCSAEELEQALRHEWQGLKHDLDNEQFEPWLQEQLAKIK